jgi:hypothetical protein
MILRVRLRRIHHVAHVAYNNFGKPAADRVSLYSYQSASSKIQAFMNAKDKPYAQVSRSDQLLLPAMVCTQPSTTSISS